MEAVFERSCGIDVHKETLTACIIIGKNGKVIKKEIRTYKTMTEDIEKLRDWLKAERVTHVAMESTGIYWRPIFNILEDNFEIILANARHIKNVPGRKTDVKDSEWLCQLLRNGLIRGSFIPPKHIRQLRDLTRHRKKINDNIASEKNRLQKYLEDANIKLSSVATDTFGVSGRMMLQEILEGNTDAEALSKLALGRLKKKEVELKKSFNSRITEHHRKMISFSLRHIEYMGQLLTEIDEEIDKLTEKNKLKEAVTLLDGVPGVDEKAAEAIIAEMGTDMSRFPSAEHIASWAGVSPGNNESAGKKKSGKTTHGDKWLVAILVQCAHGASRKKGSYLKDKYYKLTARRGKKRAAVAIAHKILVSVYYMLRDGVPYKELGEQYLDKRNETRVIRHYMNKLERLGFEVLLSERKVA